MTTYLHDIGENFSVEVLSGELTLPGSVDIMLFHDGEVSGDTTNGDDLAVSDDLSAITTEPDGGSYGRKTVNLDGATSWTISQSGGDYQFQLDATLTFDLSDSNNPGTIDAYAVVNNWDAGGGAADHLWWTDTLDSDYAVQGSFDFDDAALALSGENAP